MERVMAPKSKITEGLFRDSDYGVADEAIAARAIVSAIRSAKDDAEAQQVGEQMLGQWRDLLREFYVDDWED